MFRWHDPDDFSEGQQEKNATNQVWSYEHVTRWWTLCAPLILARKNFTCFSDSDLQTPVKQAEMYCPCTNVWI